MYIYFVLHSSYAYDYGLLVEKEIFNFCPAIAYNILESNNVKLYILNNNINFCLTTYKHTRISESNKYDVQCTFTLQ